MRFYSAYFAATLALAAPALVPAQDGSRAVSGGGVSVPGWTGKIDASRENQGLTVNDAKFVQEGKGFHITTGPAVVYWNPANKASGDYTVKATFTEPKYMNLNTHPHPYGIMIAGNDMGTPNQSDLYCAAYGNGNFIVRGFGPAAFQMNGRGGGESPTVHKASAKGEQVTQDIAMSVKGDKVECAINGTVVASYPKSDLIQPGKLKSTDGVYGLRMSHNTEVVVTGFTVEEK